MKNYINTTPIYRAFWQIPAIIFLSIILGLVSNTIRTNPLPMVGDWSTEGRLTTESGEQLIISVEDARKLFDQKSAIFMDARDAFQYEKGHIQGARNLPWHDVDAQFIDATQGISQDTPIITYCDGETCNLSHDLALFLMDVGFTNVKVLVNGWTVWVENNLPVEMDKESTGEK